MCPNCIRYTPIIPPLGVWIPCFKIKRLDGEPFLTKLSDKMKINQVKPLIKTCTCGDKIVDLISTKKTADPWTFYTPRTIPS